MQIQYLSNILPDVYNHLRKQLAADNLTMKAVLGPDGAWTVSFLNRADYRASGLTLRIPPAAETKRKTATWEDVSIRIFLEGISEATNLQPEYKLATQLRSLSRSDIAQYLQKLMEQARTFSIDEYNLSTRRKLDPEPMWAYDIVADHLDKTVSNGPRIDPKGDISFEVLGLEFNIAFHFDQMTVKGDGKNIGVFPSNDTANLTFIVARIANPFLPTNSYSGVANAVSELQRKLHRQMPWQQLLAKSKSESVQEFARTEKFKSIDDVADRNHRFNPDALTIRYIDSNAIPYRWQLEIDDFWRSLDVYVLHNRDMKIGVVGVRDGCICAYHFFLDGSPSAAAWAGVQQMASARKLHIVQNPRFTNGFVVDAHGVWHLEGGIPKNTRFTTSLVLSGFEGVSLPDDLTVKGSLTLGRHYTHLPKGLETTVLDVSRSEIDVIPGDCRVSQRLRANASKVRMICDGFSAPYADLNETEHLVSLPNGFRVKSLKLRNSSIRRLNNLEADDIDLTGSGIEEISDTVFLRGTPLITYRNILGSPSGAGPNL